MKHTITITFGALRLLRQYIIVPGTCVGVAKIYQGGKLLATLPETILPSELENKLLTDPAVKKLWATTFSIELEDAERDLCKEIVRSLADGKINSAPPLSASADNNELIIALGLQEPS
jgi:hypothetical protein